MVQGLSGDAKGRPEPLLDVVGVGEDALGLTQGDAVGLPDHVTHCGAVVLALEVGVVGVIPELVGRAVLVDQPHDLAFVLGQIRGELQPDGGIDLQAVGSR